MARSATSPLLLPFYTGGVAHHCHGWEIGALWWGLLEETCEGRWGKTREGSSCDFMAVVARGAGSWRKGQLGFFWRRRVRPLLGFTGRGKMGGFGWSVEKTRGRGGAGAAVALLVL
jgi:hypothetical protein